jgi:hypothetical protein
MCRFIRSPRQRAYKAAHSDIRLIAGDSREPRGSRQAKNAHSTGIDERAMATNIKRIDPAFRTRRPFDVLRATDGSIRFSDWGCGRPKKTHSRLPLLRVRP